MNDTFAIAVLKAIVRELEVQPSKKISEHSYLPESFIECARAAIDDDTEGFKHHQDTDNSHVMEPFRSIINNFLGEKNGR